MSNDTWGVRWIEDGEKIKQQKIEEAVRRRVEETFQKIKASKDLSYRKGQHQMAQAVTDAIFKKQTLLIEAGVGIGKSFAYLIPTLIYIDECQKYGIDYEKKVIISTSSKDLQDQLHDSDIVRLQKFLGIKHIKIHISKGIRNYVCQKQVEMVLSGEKLSKKQTDELMRMYREENFNKEINKGKYSLSSKIWKEISPVRTRGCNGCKFVARCLLPSSIKQAQEAAIIITNHGKLYNMIEANDPMVSNAAFTILDEAHDVDEQMLDNATEVFRIENISRAINRLVSFGVLRYYRKEPGIENYNENIQKSLNDFFRILRRNARDYHKKNDNLGVDFAECEETSFNPNLFSDSRFISHSHITALYNNLNDLAEKLKYIKQRTNFKYPGMEKDIERISGFYKCIIDLMGPQEYAYSVYVIKNKGSIQVELTKTPKDSSEVIKKITEGKATIFTSATMTANIPGSDEKGYAAFKANLGLQNKTGIVEAVPIPSPFDYANNSLLYHDTSVPSPTDQNVPHEVYIQKLSKKINELIKTTKGKSLVLFTNKTDMVQAHKYLTSHYKYPFEVILHDTNDKDAVDRFRKDTDSVLFSASAWQGINIPGKSLSLVLMTRLPFPPNNGITDQRTKGMSKKQAFDTVIWPAMVQKGRQGLRGNRNEEHITVTVITDSRSIAFDAIKAIAHENMPITRKKSDYNAFVKRKILTPNHKTNP